jgi:hypothetical protein
MVSKVLFITKRVQLEVLEDVRKFQLLQVTVGNELARSALARVVSLIAHRQPIQYLTFRFSAGGST